MAEDSKASSIDPAVQQSGKVYSDKNEFPVDADLHLHVKEGNEEGGEAALDGEFIKVEKELIDVKESSHLAKQQVASPENSGSGELGLTDSVSNRNLLLEEKIKELELQLKTVVGELKHSESEKALLKSDCDIANEKLEKMGRKFEELERKTPSDQIVEVQEKHNLHLETLEEALTARDMKHKELVDIKDAFTGLSAELETSRLKMKEFEAELVSSAAKTRSLEELNKNSSSRAELESKRASELEKMLELAQLNAREMEDQLGKFESELKGAYGKIAENINIEEALRTTSLELSAVQEMFEISKSQVEDLGQKIVSKDSVIHELSEELNLHKMSQEKMKTEVSSLENLLSASKEDLKEKLAHLEEVEQKLQVQAKERDIVEANFRDKEIHTTNLEKDLSTLQNNIVEFTTKLSVKEEMCIQLEEKLHMSDQKLTKMESLLSDALSYKEELEQKLNSLEHLHHESRTALESATKKNLELENAIEALNAAEDRLKAQVRESEMTSTSTEKMNTELEKQLNLANVKGLEAEKAKKELKDRIAELGSSLREVDEENSLLKCRYQGCEDRIAELEFLLSKSSSSKSELEKELNNLVEKCAEHEGRATVAHQRSLGLEDLINASHSKVADAEERVGELEQLLEAAYSQTKHLEDLLSSAETKQRDAESESRQYSSNILQLSVELEACHAQIASLNALLQAANEKERELKEVLNVADKERKNFEDLSIIQGKNLLESENLVHLLQIEVKSLRDIVKHVEEDLEASTVREKELQEKLQYAGEQLELHEKTVEEVNARNLDLKTLHESLVNDSVLKCKEAEENLKQKLSETTELQEKLKFLEEHNAHLKRQAVEAIKEITSLKAELEASSMKLIFLESNIEELKQKAADAYLRVDQTFSENEILSGTNSKLREELNIHRLKVDELNLLLTNIHVEEEATSEQLACHVETISKLTTEHSRVLELHSTTASSLKETETQLSETIQKLKERDSKITDVNREMLSLEAQMRTCKEQASESAAVAASQKEKLEATLLQLQNLEGLVEKLRSESDQLKTEKQQYTTLMEKQVEEVKQKLQEAEAQYKEKVKGETMESEMKDGTKVKSRDFESDTSTLSRRKSKKRSESTHQAPEGTSLNQTSPAAVEPPTGMVFKVILGVAIVSLIVGVILGKRY